MIGGYAIFELHSKEEAVASAVEFMQLHKDLHAGLGRDLRGPRLRQRLRPGGRLLTLAAGGWDRRP